MEKKIKFEIPDAKKREYSLGSLECFDSPTQRFFEIVKKKCKVIKKPKPSDWLYENFEG